MAKPKKKPATVQGMFKSRQQRMDEALGDTGVRSQKPRNQRKQKGKKK